MSALTEAVREMMLDQFKEVWAPGIVAEIDEVMAKLGPLIEAGEAMRRERGDVRFYEINFETHSMVKKADPYDAAVAALLPVVGGERGEG